MHKKYATVFGFSIYQDWTIQQSAGIPNFNKINSSITGAELLSQHDHTIANQVCEYDKNVVGYNRSEFCEIWLAHPAGHSVVVIDSINRNVIGYGVIRRCMLKPRIGPVFADSSEICRAIIHKLIERMSEEISKLGVAILHKSDDIRVLRIAEEIGLKNVRESFMQYTKKKIPFDESRMFVFTDYEVQYV